MSFCVLFVDDDPALLASIRRQLHSLRAKWHVLYANSGLEALETMKTQRVDLIVSDMRMPEMDGAQLFQKIKELYPDTIRVILSGQSDSDQLQQVMDAAHLLLAKPCETKTIFNLTNRCQEMQLRLSNSSVRSVITGSHQCLGSPESIQNLLKLFRNPDISVEEVSATIASDILIAGRLLGLVNSSFFGLPKPVADIDRAVVLLGLKTIKSIYMGLKISNAISSNPLASRLANNCIERGMQIGKLACDLLKERSANPQWQEDCFMAGMLSEIGMPLLATVYPDEYRKVIDSSGNDHEQLTSSEYEQFGCTHAEAGAYQLAIWGFDPRILEAVLKHDDATCDAHETYSIACAIHDAVLALQTQLT